MSIHKITDDRLFQNHPKEKIQHWCRSLYYFHYMRARGGHNCEGDSFCAHFRHEGREDLKGKLALVGVTLNKLEDGHIAFDPLGSSYDIDDLDKIRYTIAQFPDLEQPKDVMIFGQKAYIWVQANRFEISVSGSEQETAYNVSDADFDVCLALEKEFDKLNWKTIIDDDIKAHAHCISKKMYPELY